MGTPQLNAVTGAFGYSGRYIAKRLLKLGHDVVTLTNSVADDSFEGRVRAYPLRSRPRPRRAGKAAPGASRRR